MPNQPNNQTEPLAGMVVDAGAHEAHLLKMISRQERANDRSVEVGSSASTGGQLCALRAELNYVRTHARPAPPSASAVRGEIESVANQKWKKWHVSRMAKDKYWVDALRWVLELIDSEYPIDTPPEPGAVALGDETLERCTEHSAHNALESFTSGLFPDGTNKAAIRGLFHLETKARAARLRLADESAAEGGMK